MYCGNCGAVVRLGNRFCTQCGVPVVAPCPACGTLPAFGDRFCGNCSSQVALGAAKGPAAVPVAGWAAPQLLPAPAWTPVASVAPAAPPGVGPAAPPPAQPVTPIAAPQSPAAPSPAELVPEPAVLATNDDARTAVLQSHVSAEARRRAQAEWVTAGEGERRIVTILYADVYGYTRISELLDAEDAVAAIGKVFDVFARIVSDKYDGYIVKTVGDAVVATFGAPIALEDAPERAIRAALDIHAAMEKLDTEGIDLQGVRLQARIGINMGEVVVGGILADGTRRFDVMGTPVNVAARLESAAPIGGVLVASDVRARAGESFEFEATEPLRLKNVSQPVQAYVVTGVRKRESRLERAARQHGFARMVGRVRPRRVIEQALERAIAGHGGIVSVTGEAGMGKSRLVHECAQKARGQGVLVLAGQCVSFGQNVAYLPMQAVVKSATGIDDFEPEVTQRAKLTETVASLADPSRAHAPTLGWLVDVTFPGAGDQPPSGDDLHSQVRDSLTALLTGLAESQPVMVIIDDLQWLDESSQRVLEQLVGKVADRRILLVFVHRLDYSPFWDQRAENVSAVELARLTEDESRELVADRLGGKLASQAVQDEILQRGTGNPFYLEEILRALLESGRLDGDGQSLEAVSIPTTVVEIVQSRLDQLRQDDPELRALLDIAAVVQSPLRREVLEAVVTGSANVPAALAELEQRRFLRARDGGTEYDFEYRLVQETAYRCIALRSRQALHRRVAEAMEELFARKLSSSSGAIWHHYERAGMPHIAVQYLGLAIQRDLQLSTYQSLMEHVQRAVELLGPLSGDPGYRAVLAQAYSARAAARSRQGQANLAVDDCQRSIELALSAGAPDIEAQGLADLGYAFIHLGNYPAAAQYCELSHRIHSRVGYRYGVNDVRQMAAYGLHQRGIYDKALDMFVSVLEDERVFSRWTGKRKRISIALLNVGSCQLYLDEYDEALESFREVEHLAQEAVGAGDDEVEAIDPMLPVWNKANIALVHYKHGWHRRALEGLEGSIEEFRKHGFRVAEPALLKDIAECHTQLAQYDYALANAREATNLLGQIKDFGIQVEALLVEGTVHNRLGATSQAESLGSEALALATEMGHKGLISSAHLLLGYARLKQGQPHTAVDSFRAGLDSARDGGGRRAQADALMALGFGRLATGELDLAAGTFTESLQVAEEIRARRISSEARLGLGRALVGLGRMDDAVRELSTAAEMSRDIERPETLWRSHMALARVRRPQGLAEEALKHYIKAVVCLRGIVAASAVGPGPGSPRDALIDLEVEGLGTFVGLGATVREVAGPPTELVSLVQSGATTEQLRPFSSELESLFDRLVHHYDATGESFLGN